MRGAYEHTMGKYGIITYPKGIPHINFRPISLLKNIKNNKERIQNIQINA